MEEFLPRTAAEDKARLVNERAVIFLSLKRERALPLRWYGKIPRTRHG
jgi:hypothetical protein